MTSLPANSDPTLTEVQARFAEWRKSRRQRSRIPEELWAAAEKLGDNHSIYRISRALRLNYAELKERIEKARTSPAPMAAIHTPEFIPIDIAPSEPAECLVELEHHNGNRLRMHFKGKVELDLQLIAESFWGKA